MLRDPKQKGGASQFEVGSRLSAINPKGVGTEQNAFTGAVPLILLPNDGSPICGMSKKFAANPITDADSVKISSAVLRAVRQAHQACHEAILRPELC